MSCSGADFDILDITRSHGELIAYLFPAARDLKHAPSLFAAVSASHPGEVAAYALLAAPGPAERPAFLIDICRGSGGLQVAAEAALLAHLAETARILRAPTLETLTPLVDPDRQQLFAGQGFASVGRTTIYRVPLRRLYEVFDEKLARLSAAGRLPDGIVAQPYDAQAHEEELSALCNAEFGLLTHGHLMALGQYSSGNKDYSFSTQFRINGALIGAVAVGVEDGAATYDPLLVSRPYRNGWGLALVMREVAGRLLEAGVTEAIGQIRDTNMNMRALMDRLGATPGEVLHVYERSFNDRAPLGL